jgi:signal transduction histidine kinase
VKVFGEVVRRLGPDPSEVAPLCERTAYVEVIRVGVAALVLSTIALRPDLGAVDDRLIVAVTAVYLAASAVPLILRRLDVRNVLALAQGVLLVDGVYLAWITFVTGGAVSPIRFLFFVHVIVVTLLVSYRTGLKITAWNSLLFLLIVQAGTPSFGAHRGLAGTSAADTQLYVALTLAGLWMTAFATAAFSAVNERELRRQKADLGRLADMTMTMEASVTASEIARIVLDAVVDAFGFRRGVLLTSHDVDLRVAAARGVVTSDERRFGRDHLMEEAWRSRQPQLAATVHADTDPHLFELLPDARNVAVVPLMLGEGGRFGIMAFEHAHNRSGLRQWELSMLLQYASHAALALYNASLTEEREHQVEEIQSLQDELVAYNVDLEHTVAARTEKLHEVIADMEKVDEQRRLLLSHVVHAQEDERTRIANDIHDDPLQKLVAAKMQTELMQRSPGDLEDLTRLSETIRSCIASLRLLLFDLRPPILDAEGVGPAISYVLERWDADIEFDVRDDLLRDIPIESRVILYRIAHEALSNARKHADASRLDIEIKARGNDYLMQISDDGVGFDPLEVATRPGHMGLAAMRERAEMAGGRIDLHSLPGSGTALKVWLPASSPSASASDVEDDDRFRHDGAEVSASMSVA